jgi:hypothetical protein
VYDGRNHHRQGQIPVNKLSTMAHALSMRVSALIDLLFSCSESLEGEELVTDVYRVIISEGKMMKM